MLPGDLQKAVPFDLTDSPGVGVAITTNVRVGTEVERICAQM